MLSSIKPKTEHYLTPIIKHLPEVNPNVLTVIGLIFPVLFFYFTLHGNFGLGILFFLGNIFDLLDGLMARVKNNVTAFGGFLDSTFDRISDFLIISAFAYAHIVRWEIDVPFLLLAFLVSYSRARAELAAEGKFIVNIGFVERTERLIVIFFAYILYFFYSHISVAGLNLAEILFILLTILSLYTFLQRVWFSYTKLKVPSIKSENDNNEGKS